jgi:hypothetical protein
VEIVANLPSSLHSAQNLLMNLRQRCIVQLPHLPHIQPFMFNDWTLDACPKNQFRRIAGLALAITDRLGFKGGFCRKTAWGKEYKLID